MKKLLELESVNSCLNRAKNDETVFVLLARDECAPLVIRTWCGLRVGMGKNKWEDEQIQDALRCAEAMELEREKGRGS
jgi:hypothetical protein